MIAALNKVKALQLPENKIPVPGNLVFVSAPVWDSMRHVRSKDPYLQGKPRSSLQASGNSTVVSTETNSTTNSLDNPRLFFISHQNNIVEKFRSIITKTFCLAPSVVCSKNEESPQLPIRDFVSRIVAGDGTQLFAKVLCDPIHYHVELLCLKLHYAEARTWIDVSIPEIARQIRQDNFDTVFKDPGGAHASLRKNPAPWEPHSACKSFYSVSGKSFVALTTQNAWKVRNSVWGPPANKKPRTQAPTPVLLITQLGDAQEPESDLSNVDNKPRSRKHKNGKKAIEPKATMADQSTPSRDETPDNSTVGGKSTTTYNTATRKTQPVPILRRVRIVDNKQSSSTTEAISTLLDEEKWNRRMNNMFSKFESLLKKTNTATMAAMEVKTNQTMAELGKSLKEEILWEC